MFYGMNPSSSDCPKDDLYRFTLLRGDDDDGGGNGGTKGDDEEEPDPG